ncbi:putative acetyltransferase [Longimycelium tulufanense]|uniref:Putative acetyltransferase n=1 Tax=Longimycelium tulufanense TaxID=907463 RepID=A0A8J3C699_9PSEU|nr:GNAT family N-acetyltransferase [Longimycelium tulufanense]GGM38891.1 putative acetyltransferase [Longimycelium tulufanense]
MPEQVMPETDLTTSRLRLRPFRPDDAPAIQARVDAEIARWIPVPDPYDLGAARDWCEKALQLRLEGDGQQWAITDREDGVLLGSIGLTRTRWASLTSEIGYWVAAATRGRGVAAEAARAVAEWGLREMGLVRVELIADVANVASQRVAAKAGFHREGVLRSALLRRGVPRDVECWSLVRNDLA